MVSTIIVAYNSVRVIQASSHMAHAGVQRMMAVCLSMLEVLGTTKHDSNLNLEADACMAHVVTTLMTCPGFIRQLPPSLQVGDQAVATNLLSAASKEELFEVRLKE